MWRSSFAVTWKECISSLQLLAVSQQSPTGSIFFRENGFPGKEVTGDSDFLGLCNWREFDGTRPDKICPHKLRKAEAEIASPNTCAQLSPTDMPPHLNQVN